jgi:hypothetical protein
MQDGRTNIGEGICCMCDISVRQDAGGGGMAAFYFALTQE